MSTEVILYIFIAIVSAGIVCLVLLAEKVLHEIARLEVKKEAREDFAQTFGVMRDPAFERFNRIRLFDRSDVSGFFCELCIKIEAVFLENNLPLIDLELSDAAGSTDVLINGSFKLNLAGSLEYGKDFFSLVIEHSKGNILITGNYDRYMDDQARHIGLIVGKVRDELIEKGHI